MPYISHSPLVIDKAAKQHAVRELIGNASHSPSFYVLLIGATIMAIGALFTDSVPLLIASMIVAPLASPILTLGLGIVVGDWRLVGKTIVLLLAAALIVLSLAALGTFIAGDHRSPNVNITFTGSLVVSSIVALVSGVIAAYGTLQPRISSAITGIAIAVSLLPPLVATGVGFASIDNSLMQHAASIFGLNVLGILFAGMATFALFKMRRTNK